MAKVTIGTKQVSVPSHGTPVALASSTLWVTNLTIKALGANSGRIYVAPVGTTPSTGGFDLSAGQEFPNNGSDYIDLSTLQIDASADAQGVAICYELPQA